MIEMNWKFWEKKEEIEEIEEPEKPRKKVYFVRIHLEKGAFDTQYYSERTQAEQLLDVIVEAIDRKGKCLKLENVFIKKDEILLGEIDWKYVEVK